MIRVKYVYKLDGKTLYYLAEDRDGYIRLEKEELRDLIKANKVRNATIESRDNDIGILVTDIDIINITNMIELYHISLDEKDVDTFIPRIPSNGAGSEDKEIPRVCLSDSVAGAISAIPDGMDMIGEEPINMYKVRLAINDPMLIGYDTLYNKGLVPDALITHEYWYTAELKIKATPIVVNSFEDDFKYIADEADRSRIYSGIEQYTTLSESDISLIDKIDINEFVNSIVYDDNRFSEVELSLSDIMDYANITCMQYISDIDYKVGDR